VVINKVEGPDTDIGSTTSEINKLPKFSPIKLSKVKYPPVTPNIPRLQTQAQTEDEYLLSQLANMPLRTP
jgi:hypothetical protein